MIYYGLEWHSLDSYFQMKEMTAPGTPPTNELRIYAQDKSGVSALYYKNDAGTEIDLSVAGKVTARKNSGGSTFGPRSRLNLIEGTGITLTVADDSGNDEIDITLTNSASMEIGGTVTSGTAGSILFVGSGPVLAQDNANLFWDDSNNRVGLLTTSPRTTLDVRSGDITVGNFAEPANTGRGVYVGRESGAAEFAGFAAGIAGQSVIFRGYLAGGTLASPTATTTDQAVGMALNGYTGSGTVDSTASARIRLAASENWSGSAEGSYIAFDTTPAGSTTGSRAERIRILPGGHLRLTEISTDPGTGDLSSLAAVGLYTKNDKFVIAYNNGGTITYITIPLDGSTATWTHNTTTP